MRVSGNGQFWVIWIFYFVDPLENGDDGVDIRIPTYAMGRLARALRGLLPVNALVD